MHLFGSQSKRPSTVMEHRRCVRFMEQVSDQLMIRPGSLEFALRPLRLIAPKIQFE